jgi:hypothetical protein
MEALANALELGALRTAWTWSSLPFVAPLRR